MSLLRVYQLIDFKKQQEQSEYAISVPKNSKLIKAMILHDGIYIWYLVPEITITMSVVKDNSVPAPIPAMQTDIFKLLRVERPINLDEYEFIDILDVIVEVPDSGGGQQIITYPIFKKI